MVQRGQARCCQPASVGNQARREDGALLWSVPTGLAEGLPMGVQVVAPRWREDLALAAAEAIEAAYPMPTPIDPRPAGRG